MVIRAIDPSPLLTFTMTGAADRNSSGRNAWVTRTTPNTFVYRDNQGNIAGATVSGSKLQTSGNFQGTVSPQTTSFTAGAATDYPVDCTGGTVTVATTQIQYSQKVMLNFNGLSWPHVSVASLVPASPIPIPENLLPLT